MSDKNSGKPEEQKQEIPLLEWAIAVIGLLLVLGTVGFMLYKAYNSTETPPDFSVTIEKIEKFKNGYSVKFTVVNSGEQTASNVAIEGVLKDGQSDLETSSVTFDYISTQSQTKGGLFFQNDPRQFQLDIKAKSYTEP